MEDLEFDQHFADKMRQTGAPDFSDEDWERISPVLISRQQRRLRILPLWWLGALSALLLCSNIGWWWMWQQSEKHTNALHTEWTQMRPQKLDIRDTTLTKVTIYQYDTVYRTIVYQIKPGLLAQSATPALNGIPDLSAIQPAISAKELGLNNPIASNPLSETDAIQDVASGVEKSITLSRVAIFPKLPIETSFLTIPGRHPKVPDFDLVMTPQKKAHTQSEPVLIPRKFRIGAGMGFVSPQSPALLSKSGYAFHLASEIAFSEQLALTLEGAYIRIPFKGNVYDESLGLPPENLPGDDYVLQHFELNEGLKTIFQGTIGMRYWFGAGHRMSPYLGFGYALQWHPAYELKVEYHNAILDKEKEVSVKVPALSPPVSMLNFNAGLRYRFSRHWNWQTGADYQFKINANQPGIPEFWGIKSAVLFTF